VKTLTRLARQRFSTMGCPAELAVYAGSKADADRALAIARSEATRLDLKYSHYRGDSYLARLQVQAAGEGGAAVDEETAALFNFAACLQRQSGGCFDITSGRLGDLWRHSTRLPAPAAIEEALRYTGWDAVGWDGRRFFLPQGMKLDLGGIVKEYAADRIALLLRQAGFTSGYIDLGGDLGLLGPHPGGRPWRVGIRHPRTEDSAAGAMAMIEMASGGLASSGDYERFRLFEGKRYSHLIDARTGWPVAGLASVSVQAVSCLLAGALSTLAMLLGPQPGLELLAESGLPWLAHDGEQPIFSPAARASTLRAC
jgi:thiamine biosynthesis lipoprotein